MSKHLVLSGFREGLQSPKASHAVGQIVCIIAKPACGTAACPSHKVSPFRIPGLSFRETPRTTIAAIGHGSSSVALSFSSWQLFAAVHDGL